jgi:hypothetical protein
VAGSRAIVASISNLDDIEAFAHGGVSHVGDESRFHLVSCESLLQQNLSSFSPCSRAY